MMIWLIRLVIYLPLSIVTVTNIIKAFLENSLIPSDYLPSIYVGLIGDIAGEFLVSILVVGMVVFGTEFCIWLAKEIKK